MDVLEDGDPLLQEGGAGDGDGEQVLDLAGGDHERDGRREAGGDGPRHEVDEEAEPQHAHEQLHQPGQEREQDRLLHVAARHLPREQRRDGGRAGGHGAAAAQHDVDEAAQERAVQPLLRRQPRDIGVRQRLWDHRQPHRDAGDQVSYRLLRVVSVNAYITS